MSLREQAVEALHAETETWGYKAGIYELLNEAHYQLLDALLLFLTEHTEEWEDEAAAAHLVGSFIADSETLELLAALRGTTEEQ